MPSSDVDKVVYCTARVAQRREDPQAGARQDIYLRVLESDPRVEVLYGQFKVNKTEMPRRPHPQCDCCQGAIDPCPCCSTPVARVVKTEEKGSDVHLGVRLVADAFDDQFDVAVLVSGDSDLQPAVDIVRTRASKHVIVIDPRGRNHPPVTGDERRALRTSALEACQYPVPVLLPSGARVSPPSTWGPART